MCIRDRATSSTVFPLLTKTRCGAPVDGSAWDEGGDASFRVLRGGSWINAAADCRSDQSTLFATGYSTDHSAGANTSSRRKFVTMFLPKAAAVFVAIPNTTAMSMGDVVVAMPIAAALRRRWNSQQQEHCPYHHNGE